MKLNFINKKFATITIVLIIIISFFIRTYKFEEYLHFKWDQARDLFAISEAMEKGPEYLPFFGPRAVKVGLDQQLRLGPGYYYFQYLTGKIFQSNEPHVFAYFELFMSLLTIPLLYFFLRLYFSRFSGLLILLMYSFSNIVIQFSRFAWNPNVLPFFAILCFLSLVKFFRTEKTSQRILWATLWGSSLSIAFQLHFMGAVVLAPISILFVLYKINVWDYKKLSLNFTKEKIANIAKYAGAIFLAGAIFSAPTIITEIHYGGDIIKNLAPSLDKKSKEKTLLENIRRNAREHGRNYFIIVASNTPQEKTDPIKITAGLTLLVLGVISTFLLALKEKDAKKRDFLVLILIWTVFYFIVTIPIAFKHYHRYFLLVYPLPFIFLALFTAVLSRFLRVDRKILFVLVAAAVTFSSIRGNILWFKQLKRVQANGYYEVPKPAINNRGKDDITLGQLKAVADYIYENRLDNHISYFTEADYKISLEYLWYIKNQKPTYQSTQEVNYPRYFSVVSARRGGKSIPEEFQKNGKIIEEREFGQLKVYWFESKTSIPAKKPKSEKKEIGKYKIRWVDLQK